MKASTRVAQVSLGVLGIGAAVQGGAALLTALSAGNMRVQVGMSVNPQAKEQEAKGAIVGGALLLALVSGAAAYGCYRGVLALEGQA